MALTTTSLRATASAPITFTCATLGGGPRLGGDRDLDAVLDGDDCDDGDPERWFAPTGVSDLVLSRPGVTILNWTDQAPMTGPSVRYDVLTGSISDLVTTGIANTVCSAGNLQSSTFFDFQPNPPSGDGLYYLIRVRSPCGVGELGVGREALEALPCSP